MNLCACGNAAESNGSLCRRCAALQVLELRAGASAAEIKAAYRMLVKVWHPDRFQGDKAMKDTADVKLKSINTAYVFLTSASSTGDRPENKRAAAPNAASQGSSTRQEATATQSQTGKEVPIYRASRSSFPWKLPALKILVRLVLVLLAILVGRYIWIAFNFQSLTGEASTVVGDSKDGVMKELETPRRRFLNAVEQDLRSFFPSGPTPADQSQTEEPTSAASPNDEQKESEKLQPRVKLARHKIYSYITVGSTQQEVLAQLGTPTATSEDKLVYGKSELYFKNNNVVGWRIDPVSSPIKVKLWPESSVDTTLKSFTIGSRKDVVLVVQGTPTAFSENKFEYGGSEVYFQNNRVLGWKNDPASIQLRTKPY
jgi:curved DNA-binding protein CbpA